MLAFVPAPTALECLRCQRQYPVVSMPAGCPVCSEDGAPSNVQPVYSRMQSLRPGRLSGSGLPRYIAQLPVARDRLISLGEGGTPIIAAPSLGKEIGLRRILVKDERLNPTGSWRDRYTAVAISQHAGEGDLTVACAGSDSLCVSTAAYAARAGLRSVSLVDSSLAETGGRVLDAIEGVGGRAAGVGGSEARWSLLAQAERRRGGGVRCSPRRGGGGGGGRCPPGQPRRSAETPWASRATRRSPTKSSSSSA